MQPVHAAVPGAARQDPAPAVPDGVQEPDGPQAAALRRLRWRTRRGLLENDVLLERLLQRHGAALGPAALDALATLLDLPDTELLDLALGRTQPQGALASEPVRDLLRLLRAP
jgi:antitoxin CptB